jgi:hypothetical protein
MDAAETQARATIVAALIVARVVEVPTLPDDTTGPPAEAALRLRRLTAYIYDLITDPLSA